MKKPEIGPGESAGQSGQRRTGGFWFLAGGWWPDMVGIMLRAMRVDRIIWLRVKTNAKPQRPSNHAVRQQSH
jgi:hypothetical protein